MTLETKETKEQFQNPKTRYQCPYCNHIWAEAGEPRECPSCKRRLAPIDHWDGG